MNIEEVITMNTIVVTGATSMIGSAIIRSALKHNVEKVYAVVRPGSTKLDHLPVDQRICLVACDTSHMTDLPELIHDRCDVFYSIAWSLTGRERNADLMAQTVNIGYTIEAVEAAKELGCRAFVGAGSQAEYGRSAVLPMGPETATDPVQPYGIAKFAAGKMALTRASQLDLDAFWVRIFSVYGPYEKPTTMISSSLKKMKDGEVCDFTEGTQTWDFLYADDAGEAFIAIGRKAHGRKVYCLGSGEGKPLRDYILTMRDVVNPDLPVHLGAISYGPAGPLSICADITTLTEDTGWRPAISFEEGIRRTLSSHQ